MKNIIKALGIRFQIQENEKERIQFQKEFFLDRSSFQVQCGPFKGLTYPFANSLGSAFFPKILGSYECELWPVLEEFRKRGYELVFDVGCAEGFFAAGLAYLLKPKKVFAFDIDPLSQNCVENLAKANDVDEVVEYVLGNFELGKAQSLETRNLVFMDVEGAENQLFNGVNPSHFTNSDFLIECHVWENPNFAQELMEMFDATHTGRVISSWDKERKRHLFSGQISHYSRVIQDLWLEEGRRMTTDWLVLMAKNG